MMEKLLEGLADALDGLTSISKPRARPVAILVSSVLSAAVLAFSSSTYTLAAGLALLPVYTRIVGSGVGRVVRALVAVSIFSVALVLPLAALGGFSASLVIVVARAGLAASYVAAGFSGMGVNGLAAALSRLRLPHSLIGVLLLFMRFAPTYARELSRMLLARSSRIYRAPSLRQRWRLLGDAAGDLLVRGYSHAWRLSLALTARGLNPHPGIIHGVDGSGRASILYLVPALLLAVEVYSSLWP